MEFTQEPIERYGNVDAGFRDPSGNGWKMIQAAGEERAMTGSLVSARATAGCRSSFTADRRRQLRRHGAAAGRAAGVDHLCAAAAAVVLLLTGLYLFALPYTGKGRGGAGA